MAVDRTKDGLWNKGSETIDKSTLSTVRYKRCTRCARIVVVRSLIEWATRESTMSEMLAPLVTVAEMEELSAQIAHAQEYL